MLYFTHIKRSVIPQIIEHGKRTSRTQFIIVGILRSGHRNVVRMPFYFNCPFRKPLQDNSELVHHGQRFLFQFYTSRIKKQGSIYRELYILGSKFDIHFFIQILFFKSFFHLPCQFFGLLQLLLVYHFLSFFKFLGHFFSLGIHAGAVNVIIQFIQLAHPITDQHTITDCRSASAKDTEGLVKGCCHQLKLLGIHRRHGKQHNEET